MTADATLRELLLTSYRDLPPLAHQVAADPELAETTIVFLTEVAQLALSRFLASKKSEPLNWESFAALLTGDGVKDKRYIEFITKMTDSFNV